MNFIDFNINWYENRLKYYFGLSCKDINGKIIHEAKILHKFLEDIRDEGYLSTYDLFQDKLQASKYLLLFIESNNEKTFEIQKKPPIYDELIYNQTEIPLTEYLRSVMDQASEINCSDYKSMEKFYNEVLFFSKWIYDSVNSDTAIIFLLRDTLLPYLAFQFWNKDKSVTAMPFMIGRKFLFQFGDGDQIYNTISDAVYTALHDTVKSPHLFQNTAADYIKKSLRDNKELNLTIKNLLSLIEKDNICIVESGVHGTMPLLIKSMDKRVNNIKLYTTPPWFYEAWDKAYFTEKYENLRIFETLLCQDLLFKFSSIKDNIFYVQEIENNRIKKESIEELCRWNYLIGSRL